VKDQICNEINNEYAEFVLTQVVKEEEHEPAYTPEEEEKIKKWLKKTRIPLAGTSI